MYCLRVTLSTRAGPAKGPRAVDKPIHHIADDLLCSPGWSNSQETGGLLCSLQTDEFSENPRPAEAGGDR